MIIASVQNTGLKSNSQLLLYTISEQMEFEVKTTLSLMLVPPTPMKYLVINLTKIYNIIMKKTNKITDERC